MFYSNSVSAHQMRTTIEDCIAHINNKDSDQAHICLDVIKQRIQELGRDYPKEGKALDSAKEQLEELRKKVSPLDYSYSVYTEFHIPNIPDSASRLETRQQSEIVLDLGSPMKKYEDLHDFNALFRLTRIAQDTYLGLTQETRIKFEKAPDDLVIRTNRLQYRTIAIKNVPEDFTLPSELIDEHAQYKLTKCHVLMPELNYVKVLEKKTHGWFIGNDRIRPNDVNGYLKYGYAFHYARINKPATPTAVVPTTITPQTISWKMLAWKASVATCGFLWRSFTGGIEYMLRSSKKTD
ncbi:MAG: hypothetical protein K1000chlam2_01626 [Chlamydiae bacterium]|nr:hypothetical protein [Chlamydiota bacterium]